MLSIKLSWVSSLQMWLGDCHSQLEMSVNGRLLKWDHFYCIMVQLFFWVSFLNAIFNISCCCLKHCTSSCLLQYLEMTCDYHPFFFESSACRYSICMGRSIRRSMFTVSCIYQTKLRTLDLYGANHVSTLKIIMGTFGNFSMSHRMLHCKLWQQWVLGRISLSLGLL